MSEHESSLDSERERRLERERESRLKREHASRLKHSDLLYDYIKFHLGLYLATPAALVVIGNALHVTDNSCFRVCILGLMAIYALAGAHASWTVASFVNVRWDDDHAWVSFGHLATSPIRRFIHHYLYWIGLAVGLVGILFASTKIC